jgi:hypothetical protein
LNNTGFFIIKTKQNMKHQNEVNQTMNYKLFNLNLLRYFIISFYFFTIATQPIKANTSQVDSLENVYQRSQNPTEQAMVLLELSNYYSVINLEKAASYIQQSILLVGQIQDNQIKYDIYKQAGVVCFYIGIFDQASTYWIKALSIANDLKDSLQIAKSSFNLSALYIAIKNVELANDYLMVSKQYFDSRQDVVELRPQMLSILNNQAIIFQNSNDTVSAIKMFKEAIYFAKKHDLMDGLKTTLNAYASFLISQKSFSEAELVLLELQGLNKVFSYNPQIDATLLIKLSRVFSQVGQKDKAKKYLLSADSLVNQIQSMSLYRELTNDLYLLALNEGNELKALRYKVIYDSLTRENKAEIAMQDGIKIKLLKEFKALESQTAKSNAITVKRYVLGIGFLSLLLLLFVYFLIKNVRKKKRLSILKQIVVQEREQLAQLNDSLFHEVEKKEKELTSQSIHHMRQKELLKSSIEELQKSLQDLPVVSRQAESKMNQMASVIEDRQVWSDFDIRFNELNTGFYKKLDTRFPNLTINEKRLCAFLKLEMNTKEIIAITGQSVRAVEIARTRLRKKLELTNSSRSLNDFFKTF